MVLWPQEGNYIVTLQERERYQCDDLICDTKCMKAKVHFPKNRNGRRINGNRPGISEEYLMTEIDIHSLSIYHSLSGVRNVRQSSLAKKEPNGLNFKRPLQVASLIKARVRTGQ